MDDALLVRRVDRFGDLTSHSKNLVQGQRSGSDPVRKRRTFDELQHQALHTARFLETVDGGNVRVVQRREHLRLAPEPRDAIGIQSERPWQHLQRDVAIQLRVAGAVHLAHGAGADQ